MPITMLLATAAWFCLCLGLYARFNPVVHSRWMRAGIALDLLIVLYLQFTQSAVQQALSFSLEFQRQIHIGFSALAVALYVPVLILGYALLHGRGTPRTRVLHIRFGLTAFAARTVGFVFMYTMLS